MKGCTCLEVFGEDPNCPLHGVDAVVMRLRDLAAGKHADVSAADEAADLIEWLADRPTAALAKAWRPISEAKKDGVPLLVRFRDDLPARVSGFSGKCAVMVWAGRDGGEWHYHGPIGMGGFPDEWIDGWMPLPPEAGER